MLQGLTTNAILIIGAYLIMDSEFTIGMLLAFQGFLSSVMSPVEHLTATAETVIEMRTQMERVEDVLNYPVDEKNAPRSDVSAAKLGGKVELRNITFGYNKFSPPQIRDFSLTLEPGQSVALVGTSGCGKSTLAKLITGLYRPWVGEILFDGRPIEEINADEFTNSVALIDQNVVMFDDTVAANIKMWDTSIEDFAMVLACKDAQIREDVISRPKGFNTRLVKGGKNFSGGQLQRMEIAAALAREPVVLIMDEATSALDAETEKRIMTSIKMTGATLIIIAHRLSTIRDCDEIIVLDKGVVVERGSHKELVENDGLYKQLVLSD
jgi:ABC-type bacteriocin/lantibiotic exporter with double-glycine peptidase domain